MRPFAALPRFKPINREPENVEEKEESSGFAKRGYRFQAAASLKANSLFKHDKIAQLPLFQGRDPRFVGQLLLDIAVEVFQPGATILKEGDSGESMYLLNRGEVEIVVGGNVVATLRDGSVFGEIALLGVSSKRTATVRALSFCDCRVIQRRIFLRLLEIFPQERLYYEMEARRRFEELQEQQNPKPKARGKLSKQGAPPKPRSESCSPQPQRTASAPANSDPFDKKCKEAHKLERRCSSQEGWPVSARRVHRMSSAERCGTSRASSRGPPERSSSLPSSRGPPERSTSLPPIAKVRSPSSISMACTPSSEAMDGDYDTVLSHKSVIRESNKESKEETREFLRKLALKKKSEAMDGGNEAKGVANEGQTEPRIPLPIMAPPQCWRSSAPRRSNSQTPETVHRTDEPVDGAHECVTERKVRRPMVAKKHPYARALTRRVSA